MTSLTLADIDNYGIVYTPDNLVDKILDLIPIVYFQNPNLTWLDLGAGNGAFSRALFKRLVQHLQSSMLPDADIEAHILQNMIYMVEIYPAHIDYLKTIFHKPNIIERCFLSLDSADKKFDFIIGNPPYNINGAIKTPTNTSLKKSDDGKAIYVDFVYKSLELLKPDGFINFIIPSIWLKPDKARLYKTLTHKTIHKLCCLSTAETQKMFDYKAQTPTCYFLIQNRNNNLIEKIEKIEKINIYDKLSNTFIPYELRPDFPIPTHGISIINKMLGFVDKYGYLKVYKTTTPTSKTRIEIAGLPYKNIKTCLLTDPEGTMETMETMETRKPRLVINYSNIPQQFDKIPKLVLANKMYGIPYLDASGEYGISTRDNYVISSHDYSIPELRMLQSFLSTKTALFLFSTTNYRMRYLERYAFQFIPDVTQIMDFDSDFDFGFSDEEKNHINCATNKKRSVPSFLPSSNEDHS